GPTSVDSDALVQPGASPAAGGSIEGRAVLVGSRPIPARLPTNESVSRTCGASVQDQSLLVSPDGGIENVVVWVESAPEKGADKVLPSPTVDQRGCRYGPPVLAARAGSHLTLLNSDPLI